MGRYYTGDIEGKFWFGVQASDDASFFGGEEIEPNYLEYYFDETRLSAIAEGIAECKKQLGDHLSKLTAFFNQNNGYSDGELMQYLDVDAEKKQRLLVWYARLELGEKILACVQRSGSCTFEAEL